MDGCGYKKMCDAWYVEGNKWSSTVEAVALEEAVGICCNGCFVEEISCTPEDLEDLAVGYLFTSGRIGCRDELESVEVCGEDCAVTVRVVAPPRAPVLAQRASLQGDGSGGAAGSFRIAPEAVHRASSALLDVQAMHRATGATHAAAFADLEGHYRYVREDIGRHNAVDKLIGALLRDCVDPTCGFVHLSSRCALDLVRKCAAYGIRLISTVSAPTSAVLSFADEQGITLCAFARNGHFTVYTHPENLVAEPAA